MGVRGLGEEKTDPWKGGVREGLRKEVVGQGQGPRAEAVIGSLWAVMCFFCTSQMVLRLTQCHGRYVCNRIPV